MKPSRHNSLLFRIFSMGIVAAMILSLVLPAGQVVFAQEEDPQTVTEETSETETESGSEAESNLTSENNAGTEEGQNSGSQAETEASSSESNSANESDENVDETGESGSGEGENQETNSSEGNGDDDGGDGDLNEEETTAGGEGQEEKTVENNIGEAVDALIEGNAALLDENGDPLTLASQETQDILSSALDPQFCPDGYSPSIWDGDDSECGPVHDNIAAAIQDAIKAGISGTIYIQAGTFNEFVNLEGYKSQVTLVFLGGVTKNQEKFEKTTIGTPKKCEKECDIVTVEGGGIRFSKNNVNLTLANFVLNNGHNIVFEDNIGNLTLENIAVSNAKESGIVVKGQEGNVTLDQVIVTNSGDDGISIENRPDQEESSTAKDEKKDKKEKPGDVTVTNTTVIGNQGDGIKIVTAGNVFLNNVIAVFNWFDGVDIDNSRRPTGKPEPLLDVQNRGSDVTVINSVFIRNGTSHFLRTLVENEIDRGPNRNGRNGLEIESSGNVNIFNIRAARNSGHGTLIETRGNVFVFGSTFVNNGFNGRSLIRSEASLFADINHRRPSAGNGLDITTNGNVRLVRVRAVRNDQLGISIETLNKQGQNINRGENLGNVFLGFVAANRNERGGAEIDAVGNVIVFGSEFRCNGNECFRRTKSVTEINELSLDNETLRGRGNRDATGLDISTSGNVFLLGVDANRNSGLGITIETYLDRQASRPDSVEINHGQRNSGQVILVRVTANKNDQGGARINAVGDVRVFRSEFSCNDGACQKKRLPSLNAEINHRGRNANGLSIRTTGNVTLKKISADNNSGYGVVVKTFSPNFKTLWNSRNRPEGNVRFVQVIANGNSVGGARIDNSETARVTLPPDINKYCRNTKDQSCEKSNRGFDINVKLYCQLHPQMCGSPGNVTIARSMFGYNGNPFNGKPFVNSRQQGPSAGIQIESRGNVAISQVVANYNYGYGIDINTYQTKNSPRTSLGNVVLQLVAANGNTAGGATIDAVGNVSVFGGWFSRNYQRFLKSPIKTQENEIELGRQNATGLNISTTGNVLVFGVIANRNSGYGIEIETNELFKKRPVPFSGTGAEINPLRPQNGRVTLIGVMANHNRQGGATIDSVGNTLVALGMFNCNGTRFCFYDGNLRPRTDEFSGLDINSPAFDENQLAAETNFGIGTGNVTLLGVIANGNRGYGVDIETNEACFNLICQVEINRRPGRMPANGLKISSTANVLVAGVMANGNRGDGIDIKTEISQFGRPIPVSGPNRNISLGEVVLRRVTANSNRRGGADIDAVDNVRVFHSDFNFNGNGIAQAGAPVVGNEISRGRRILWANGLDISTTGNVVLRSVDARNNSGYGISIETYRDRLKLRPDTVDINFGKRSGGRVSLINVATHYNQFGGTTVSARGDVYVYRSNFSQNGLKLFSRPLDAEIQPIIKRSANGLEISSHGNVYLERVHANGNSGHGVYVNVISRQGPQTVTLNHVYARLNGKSGAFVSNHSHGRSLRGPARGFGGVFVSYSTFINNAGNGLRVVSNQPVTVRHITARRNGRNGAIIQAYGRDGDVKVGHSYLGGNRYSGLVVRSTGEVTLRYNTANNNRFGSGVFVRADGRILAGYNTFNNNGWNGITARSQDRIVLRYITACYNGNVGARVNSIGNVRVVYSDFCENKRSGVGIRSAGEVRVMDVDANENGGNGIRIWNQSGNDIFIENTIVTSNTTNGIGIHSAGFIDLTQITATGNSGNGVALYNQGGTGIDIITGTFSNNGENGILAISDGKIFIDDVEARNNVEAGARLTATLGTKEIWILSIALTGNGTYGIHADVGDGTLFYDCGLDLRNNGLGTLVLNWTFDKVVTSTT
jgi:hypothetical protein